PSTERRSHTADTPAVLDSQAAYRRPESPASSAWKLCEPKASPSLTLTGALHVAPPSTLRAYRSALWGNRAPTSRPTVYNACTVPSGPATTCGGASPCGSIEPSGSVSTDCTTAPSGPVTWRCNCSSVS